MAGRHRIEFTAAETEWMEFGACSGMGPEAVNQIFFNPDAIEGAKAICASCVVVEPCLEFALSNNEYGVWGGTAEDERRAIRKARSQSRRAS